MGVQVCETVSWTEVAGWKCASSATESLGGAPLIATLRVRERSWQLSSSVRPSAWSVIGSSGGIPTSFNEFREGSMGRYAFLVLTNAKSGQDAEFNDWYTNTHLDDLLRLEGFVAAQRFQVVEGAHESPPPHRYMAIYEIEADDLALAQKALAAAAESGAMFVSPSLERGTAAWYFEPITDRLSSTD